MAGRWDAETTMKFIQEYKFHECLWNCYSPSYKSKRLRDAAYDDLVQTMDLPGFGVPEVKVKIKNLRSTYFQEKKKILNSKKSGSGSDSVYTPNIKWFGELDSILHYMDQRRQALENNEEEDDVESFASTSQIINEATVDSASASQYPNPAIARLVKAPKGRSKDIARAISELKQLQDSIHQDIPPNQFDIFGSSVAAQLKSLPYDKALLAQSQIQALLTDIAIEDYRSSMTSEESEVILP